MSVRFETICKLFSIPSYVIYIEKTSNKALVRFVFITRTRITLLLCLCKFYFVRSHLESIHLVFGPSNLPFVKFKISMQSKIVVSFFRFLNSKSNTSTGRFQSIARSLVVFQFKIFEWDNVVAPKSFLSNVLNRNVIGWPSFLTERLNVLINSKSSLPPPVTRRMTIWLRFQMKKKTFGQQIKRADGNRIYHELSF